MNRQVLSTALLMVAALLPSAAIASTYSFNFAGPGVSGTVNLTYGATTDTKSHGFEVTGISGTFSDSNNGLNITDTPIGSLLPLNHASPDITNLLAPNDFSKFYVTTGLAPVAHGALTYDNLYYPGGSPATASDYPASGGFLDIYGLMFNIGGGQVVDFWSNGTFDPSVPVDYGVAVATSANALDYVTDGVNIVPEPGSLALFGLSFIGALAWRTRNIRRS